MLDSITISDPRAAAVFNNLRQRQLLFSLMENECSLGGLAHGSRLSLNLLHHHVGRFISLGLAEISGIRLRAGAPIKLYRATARAFFVPARLAGAPTNPLNAKLREALERGLAGTYKGVVYTRDQVGVKMRLVTDKAQAVRVSELWGELDLSDADAAALAEDLKAVLLRYASNASRKGRRRFIVHAALAPHRE